MVGYVLNKTKWSTRPTTERGDWGPGNVTDKGDGPCVRCCGGGRDQLQEREGQTRLLSKTSVGRTYRPNHKEVNGVRGGVDDTNGTLSLVM